MSIPVITLILFGSFFLLLATGFPIAWVLASLGILFSLILIGPKTLITTYLTTWDTMSSFILIAIPLFIFMGYVLQKSGLATALYHSMLLWSGRLPGGLAIGTVFICTIIAAMVGTLSAGIVTATLIGLPEMEKRRYNKRMVIGAIMAGGTLGVLIPPSVGFLIYAGATGISVGRLFAAGLLPGLLLSGLYMSYIGVRCVINPSMGPPLLAKERVGWAKKILSLKDSILAVVLVTMVLGSIFAGIATPTEAAAVGAFLTLVIAAIYRKLNVSLVRESLYGTLNVFTMIFFIYVGASIFGRFYMGIGTKVYLNELIAGLAVSRWVVLWAMMFLIFIAGMVIHADAIVLVLAPIFSGIVVNLGYDPLWFALLFLVNIQIAGISPPFGPALFYLKGCVGKKIDFKDIMLSAYPYMGLQIIGLIICFIFPQIVLWLPKIFFG